MYRGYNLQNLDTTFFGTETATSIAAAFYELRITLSERNIKGNLESFLNVNGSVRQTKRLHQHIQGAQLDLYWTPVTVAEILGRCVA